MKKVFTFGNGGVLVHGSWSGGYIKLTQIKPPVGYVGKILEKDLENKEELYSLTVTKKENAKLLKGLRSELRLLKGSSVIMIDDAILDFTTFNIESVKIVIRAIDEAIRGYSQLALAC